MQPTPPAEISAYISSDAWNEHLRRAYFDGEGRKVASSRMVPAEVETPPVGAWRMDSRCGLHGHELAQLREVDPQSLEISEADWSVKQNCPTTKGVGMMQGAMPSGCRRDGKPTRGGCRNGVRANARNRRASSLGRCKNGRSKQHKGVDFPSDAPPRAKAR